MTDALWNGIIGAGGAAICCAVYFGFKAARKGISKIKFSKSQPMPEQKSEQPNIDTTANSAPKQVTITLPTRKQIFTLNNFKALVYLLLAIICFVGLEDLRGYNGYLSIGHSLYSGDDYADNVSSNLSYIATSSYNTFFLLREAISYVFGVVGGLFALKSITTFKFK